uniref:VWFC domain-containing protein n=1 Tax=Oryzias melastigma TaxID=30732 RepID=A0A3B3D6Z9_ORYME
LVGCTFQGREYLDGTEFNNDNDPCGVCYCYGGNVVCSRLPCPVQCFHPVPSDSCCPDCDSCLYEGVIHAHAHTFTPSYDLCRRCTCVRGEVRCASPGCPELPCVHQVTDPGSCCPRCRGCVYGGEEHSEGSSWFADSTPCMSCQCVDGVTTCSEVHCLSPCVNFLSVPGECCPVCADSMVSCSYQGATYRSYQQWEVDECTSCTCVSGDVHCRTERCPPLTCASVSCRFFCHSWEAIPVNPAITWFLLNRGSGPAGMTSVLVGPTLTSVCVTHWRPTPASAERLESSCSGEAHRCVVSKAEWILSL